LYAFRHTTSCNSLRVTVCAFCEVTLAYSVHPEYLIIVEEHHTCAKMRDFFSSNSVPDAVS
jgi:hypothetical protein